MRKVLLAILLLLSLAAPCLAEDVTVPPGTVAATLQNAAVANGNGFSIGVGGLSSYVLQVAGTLGGATTVNFEASMDSGTTWQAIEAIKTSTGAVSTTTTSTGAFYLNVAGWNLIRARVSAYAGGDTVTVTGRGSLASSSAILTSSSGGGTQDVNLTKVGGTAIAIGQAAMAASLPVVLASNQSNVPTNTVQLGGIAINLGNGTTGTGTQRVTLSSDSTGQVVLAGGSATIGALTANQSVNVAQINGVTTQMGNGTTGTGTQRVTLSSDSTGQVALAAGAATIGALTANQSVNVAQLAGTTTAVNSGANSNGTLRVTVATDDTLKLAQASTTSGQIGVLAQGAVTTAAPSYTTAKTNPLSMDTFGNLRVGTQTMVTYSCSATGIATAATPTDVFTIIGSGTKTVLVTRIQISGVATAATSGAILLIKRSTADTGGTHTEPAIVPLDSASAAATAVVSAYTANPTLGTAVGTIRTQEVSFTTAATSSIPAVPGVFLFGMSPEQFLTLRGTAEQLCINLNGVTLTGGVLQVDIEFVEF